LSQKNIPELFSIYPRVIPGKIPSNYWEINDLSELTLPICPGKSQDIYWDIPRNPGIT